MAMVLRCNLSCRLTIYYDKSFKTKTVQSRGHTVLSAQVSSAWHDTCIKHCEITKRLSRKRSFEYLSFFCKYAGLVLYLLFPGNIKGANNEHFRD